MYINFEKYKSIIDSYHCKLFLQKSIFGLYIKITSMMDNYIIENTLSWESINISKTDLIEEVIELMCEKLIKSKDLYKIGKCNCCGRANQILRPSPFIADKHDMICKYCWNDIKKEYMASMGKYIPDFNSEKNKYNNLLDQMKQKRKIVFPAIYKHFKNKYYATMGIPIIIPMDKFITLEKHPNIISFNAEHTESGELYKIIRNKKQFYTYDDGYNTYNSNEQLILYKSLYDGHCPYLRPLSMFISEVDKIKYPKVKQKYRFELIKY